MFSKNLSVCYQFHFHISEDRNKIKNFPKFLMSVLRIVFGDL